MPLTVYLFKRRSLIVRNTFVGHSTGSTDNNNNQTSNTLVAHSTGSTNNNNNQTSSGVPNSIFARYGTADVIVATDAEISNATRLLWKRLNVIVEPIAAIGLAILLEQ